MALRDLLRNDELPVRLLGGILVVWVNMVDLVLRLLDDLALLRELVVLREDLRQRAHARDAPVRAECDGKVRERARHRDWEEMIEAQWVDRVEGGFGCWDVFGDDG